MPTRAGARSGPPVDNGPTPGLWSYRWDMTTGHELRDEDMEREIELVGSLVLAAGQSEGRLPDDQIDEILGVDRDGRRVAEAP